MYNGFIISFHIKKMENEIKNEVKNEESKVQEAPKMRKIIIETDGKNIHIEKIETTPIETMAIFRMVIELLNKPEEPEKKEDK